MTVAFKNVAYESFQEPDFVVRLEECCGKRTVAKILSEHPAAPEDRQPTLGL